MHLLEPADRVPEGVTVEIKHFLSVPRDPEVKEYMEGNGHWHDIVKVTMEGGTIDLETVGEAQPGLTEENMFSTTMFQDKSFCHVLATDGGRDRYTCTHSAPKVITLSRNSKFCPHTDDALSLHCFSNCTAANGATQMNDRKFGKEKFERDLRSRSDVRTNLSVDLVTVKNNKKYNIFVSANKTFSDQPYQISHDLICQYDGSKRFGTLSNVHLGCCESNHCNIFKKIHIKVNADVTEAGDEAAMYDMAPLECIPVQQTFPSNNAGKTLPSKTAFPLNYTFRSSWFYFSHPP